MLIDLVEGLEKEKYSFPSISSSLKRLVMSTADSKSKGKDLVPLPTSLKALVVSVAVLSASLVEFLLPQEHSATMAQKEMSVRRMFIVFESYSQ